MFGWLGDVVNAVVDFVTGGDGSSNSTDPCDEGECGEARAARNGARAAVENACHNTKLALLVFRTTVRAVTLPPVSYIAILIVAFLIAGPIGIFIAIAIYAFLLLLLRAWAPVVEGALNLLAATYQAEGQAIRRVLEDCPPECQDDISATDCDLGSDGTSVPTTPFDNWLGLAGRFGRN